MLTMYTFSLFTLQYFGLRLPHSKGEMKHQKKKKKSGQVRIFKRWASGPKLQLAPGTR